MSRRIIVIRLSPQRALTGRMQVLLVVVSGAMASNVIVPATAAPVSQRARSNRVVQSGEHGESYVLGAGDRLRVTVTDYPEFSQDSIVIPPDGTVTLPNFGTLRLSGKTRLGVQREMATTLQRKVGLRDPAVAVSITQFRPNIIGTLVLAGDVPRSGTFDIRVNYRLSDLLADAGLQDRLEEREATLTRRGGAIRLQLKAAAAAPRGGADIALRPGDSIVVRRLKAGRITLLGDLARSGVYEIHRVPRGDDAMELGASTRLSDLITKAGGLRLENQLVLANSGASGRPTNGQASPTFSGATLVGSAARATYRGFLQRRGQRVPLDPEKALAEIAGPANIRLQNGDVVTIQVVPPPQIPQPLTVYLDGLSTRTGAFQVAPGTGVFELITTAGGLAKAPDGLIASVRRGTQTLPLDLPTLLLSSESGANLKLENGDIVQLREPDTIEVQVAGRVAKAGTVRLKPGATVLDALLESGGLAIPPEGARLNVLRKEADGTQSLLKADAAGIIGLRDISTNFPLRSGDLVNVAQNETQTVTISGQVNTSNSFQLREGEGLPELIIRAGGAKPDAALTRVSVTREGKIITVDAYDAVKEGKPLSFMLQDGDFVVIPQNTNRVLVMEAVARPGYYAIPERGRLTLLEVLAQATPQQNTKTVLITRAKADGSIDVNAQPRTVSLDELRRGKQANFDLSPRDIVFVPSAKSPRNLLQTLSSLSVFRIFFP